MYITEYSYSVLRIGSGEERGRPREGKRGGKAGGKGRARDAQLYGVAQGNGPKTAKNYTPKYGATQLFLVLRPNESSTTGKATTLRTLPDRSRAAPAASSRFSNTAIGGALSLSAYGVEKPKNLNQETTRASWIHDEYRKFNYNQFSFFFSFPHIVYPASMVGTTPS